MQVHHIRINLVEFFEQAPGYPLGMKSRLSIDARQKSIEAYFGITGNLLHMLILRVITTCPKNP